MRLSNLRSVGAGAITSSALVLILAASGLVNADDQPDPKLRAGGSGAPMAGHATDEQLEKLVAPIAIYPDKLLDDVLGATQYPSQLAAAADFIKSPKGALQVDPSWPPSVKALLKYPSVLLNLDGNLMWAVRLGNAAKSQQKAVEAAIQYVRGKAAAAGNLKTTSQQTVTDDNGDYEIQPASADVTYVPQYDPAYLYVPGAYYGGYGYVGRPMLAWGSGVALGAALADHHYVHGGYPHYTWAHPGAGHAAGVTQGRRQGFAAGAAATQGGNHVHYHIHNYAGFGGGGFNGGGFRSGAARAGAGGSRAGGFEAGGARMGGFQTGGSRAGSFQGGGFGDVNHFSGGAGFGGFRGGGMGGGMRGGGRRR